LIDVSCFLFFFIRVKISLPYKKNRRASKLHTFILENFWTKVGLKVLFRILAWNVRGRAHKAEELDSVLNKKQIKIAAITEPKKKLKSTMETNNCKQKYRGTSWCSNLDS
jgi:hypothetical protein